MNKILPYIATASLVALSACTQTVTDAPTDNPKVSQSEQINIDNAAATQDQHPSAATEMPTEVAAEVETEEDPDCSDACVPPIVNTVLQPLAKGNYEEFAKLIHPEKGVQFSMSAYIRPDRDVKLSQAEFVNALKNNKQIFYWGDKDGTGEPYRTNLRTYLNDWIRASEFEDAMVSTMILGKGNNINNISDVYPELWLNRDKYYFLELYRQGTQAYAEMDWRSLRLVFEEFNGQLYLVAIINDQWTI